MTEEFERLKDALRKPATPQSMREASEAFRRYRTVELAKGRGSRPTLVTLSQGKGFPYAVPVDRIPDELATNPEFYNFVKKIVTRGK